MDQNLKALLGGEAIEAYAGGQYKPGVICWAAIPYLSRGNVQVIRPLSYDSTSENYEKFSLTSVEMKQVCVDTAEKSKLPHATLKLRSNEELIACQFKRRPVVILTPTVAKCDQGFPRHFHDSTLCAPLFTVVDVDGFPNQRYSQKAIERVVALQYRKAFPLPTSPHLKSRISVIRLDRIGPVYTENLILPELKVTNRWLSFIREWIRYYATGRLEEKARSGKKESFAEMLSAAQSLLGEQLAKD